MKPVNPPIIRRPKGKAKEERKLDAAPVAAVVKLFRHVPHDPVCTDTLKTYTVAAQKLKF